MNAYWLIAPSCNGRQEYGSRTPQEKLHIAGSVQAPTQHTQKTIFQAYLCCPENSTQIGLLGLLGLA